MTEPRKKSAAKRPPGRPYKLTEARTKRVAEALASGCYREVAARAAGLSHSSFYSYMEKGEADELEGRETIFSRFRNAVLEAEAKAETEAVSIIRAAAPETWQAAAWLLERKHPDRWGRRLRMEAEATVTADVEVVHSKVVEVVPEEAQRRAVAEILGESLGATLNGAAG